MFDKPRKSKPKYLDDDGVFRHPDLREVCDSKSKKGRDEYSRRVTQMLKWQSGRCGLQITPECKAKNGRLSREYAQFGHASSRGFSGGKRDDRIEVDGKRTDSMALCPRCNAKQGSRKITDFIDCMLDDDDFAGKL